MPADLDPRRFEVLRAPVGEVEVAYVREGEGGFPLVLVHGWPETKRIWWRNIEPLAAAGFEVIVPDLRGFGDSGLAPDGAYDVATQSGDLQTLIRDVLGHDRCIACGGDLGGVVCQDMALRYEGLVARQVLFNTIPPILPAEYADAGIPTEVPQQTRMAADYFVRQGREADALALELDTPEARRRYVAEMYGPRFWAAPGGFTPDEAEFQVEPFGDADSFRASLAIYEYAMGSRRFREPPRLLERSPIPTLVLYGPDDHVIPRTFPRQMEVAFTECVGPFIVEGSGHFLQWEQADKLNQAIRYFCLDLIPAR
jgi:pimeloyl-ACP methyl ester carboxylesterase